LLILPRSRKTLKFVSAKIRFGFYINFDQCCLDKGTVKFLADT